MASEKPTKPDTRFKPGNPGKPRGALNRTTIAAREMLCGEGEAIVRKAIELAKGGDMAAVRLCIERIVPAMRDQPIAFTLPPISTAADAVAASSALLSAVAEGEVTPGEAQNVMGLLTSHKGLLEAGEFEARLVALEKQMAA